MQVTRALRDIGIRHVCALAATVAFSSNLTAQAGSARQQAAEERFFDSNGARLRYVDRGQGEPIVLVHGFGNRIETWTTLTGISFLTATLVAGAGRFTWTAQDDTIAEQEAAERERDCVSRTLIYRLAPAGEPKPTDDAIRKASAECFADPTQDRSALAAVTRSRGQQALSPEKVKAMRVPTLAIVGNLDTARVALRELKKLRPEVQLVVVDGATHGGQRGILRRGETIAAIRAFIVSHRQPSTGRQ